MSPRLKNVEILEVRCTQCGYEGNYEVLNDLSQCPVCEVEWRTVG